MVYLNYPVGELGVVRGKASGSGEPGGCVQGWLLGFWSRSQGVGVHTPGGNGNKFWVREVDKRQRVVTCCTKGTMNITKNSQKSFTSNQNLWEILQNKEIPQDGQNHCKMWREWKPIWSTWTCCWLRVDYEMDCLWFPLVLQSVMGRTQSLAVRSWREVICLWKQNCF